MLEIIERAESEVFQDVDGGLGEEVADALVEFEGEGCDVFDGVLLDEGSEWEEEIVRDRVREVPAEFQVWVLGELGCVCAEGGGVVGGCVVLELFAGWEIYGSAIFSQLSYSLGVI